MSTCLHPFTLADITCDVDHFLNDKPCVISDTSSLVGHLIAVNCERTSLHYLTVFGRTLAKLIRDYVFDL